MRKRMKKAWILILILTCVFTATACGGSTEGGESGSNGGEVIFTVAIPSGYDTFNFFATESSMVYDWLNFCYDSLLAYDENYNAVPRAAESWDVSDDGATWTFKLREDIYFSDGEQLTAEDVKWTYENASESYMYSTHAEGFASIETPDDFTVVFKCESEKPDMLYQVIPILPKHVWENVDMLTYEDDELVGSGPFIYSAERSGNGNISFVKNENYWGQVPKIDVLTFSEYDNSDAMAQALQIGEVDACYRLEGPQYESLKDTDGILIDAYDTYDFEYLGYNLADPILADVQIRHAIDYCFDKELAIEMGYSGIGEPAYGPVTNEGYQYQPKEPRNCDIDKAKEILDKAGYVDTNGDGIREKDGTPLSIELTTASERSSWQSSVVNMLITNCGEAGIEIKWNPIEKVTMWDICADGNPDWQMNLDGWGGDADPGFIMCIFQDYETSGYAGVSYQSSDFDKAYQQVYNTTDQDKRAGYIEACQEILYEDCPYTYICFVQNIQAINTEKWTGYKASSHGLFDNEQVYNYVNIAPAN